MIRAFVIVLLTVRVSHAENPKLIEARAAIQDVRYDEAQRLLVDALRLGANGPDELAEIYQLSAAAAIVLGDHDLAQLYYRRMLSIIPTANLPADASPRLRQPFVAAQAFMAAQPRFEIRAVSKAGAIEVHVSDPLHMVVAVIGLRDGVNIAMTRYAGGPVVLQASDLDTIAAVDEHGNHLRRFAAVIDRVQQMPPSVQLSEASSPSLLRRWTSWAVPGGVFATVGVSFLIAGQVSKKRLDDIVANSQTYYFNNAESARASWRRNTQIATVSLAVAGGCAAVAAVMALVQPRSRAHVTGSVMRDEVVVGLTGNF